ncbi:MAG: cytochrome c oxidase assembly protein [Actinobacteria bacterium]|nr:cytochrome c oxidase assembly protein [Actinomycetota bacterium]
MPIGSVAANWNLEPLQLVPTLVVSLLYLRRTRSLAARGQAVAAWRQWVFWIGIALVVVALNSPVDWLGEHDFFFVHMLQHVILGDLAPLCFVAGLTGPVLRPVLALRPVERLRVLTHPLVALPVWAVNLCVWHVPFLYQAALHHSAVHALEHFLFFTCGALMWSPVLETLPAPQWFGTGMKLGYIAIVRVIETIVGNVFIWSSHVYYPWYVHPHPIWGINAVHDQNLAGVVMMIEGSFVTLGALVWLFLRLASEGELRQQLIEQGYDRAQVARAVRYGRAHALGGEGQRPANT